jgi:hypothetical protein
MREVVAVAVREAARQEQVEQAVEETADLLRLLQLQEQ